MIMIYSAAVSRSDIEKVIQSSFGSALINRVVRLTEGIDFEVYRISFQGDYPPVILKVAPCNDTYLSPYDGWVDYGALLRREYIFYNRVRQLSSIPVPRIYKLDVSKRVMARPFMIIECLPGSNLEGFFQLLSLEDQRQISKKIGQLTGQLHMIDFPQFGPLENPLTSIWVEYYVQRLSLRLGAIKRYGVISHKEKEHVERKAREILNSHPSSQPILLHMDIRHANIIVSGRRSSLYISGIIDPANAVAGDPRFELARIEAFGTANSNFWEGYREIFPNHDIDLKIHLIYLIESEALLTSVYKESIKDEDKFRKQAMKIKNTVKKILDLS